MDARKLKLLLTTFTVLGVAAGGTVALVHPANVLASSTKADYSLAVNPSSQTIQSVQSAQFTVVVSPLAGSSAVALSVGKLPSGSTACWNPTTVSNCATG